MNTDGTGMSQLTDDPNRYDTAPSWSPDGSHVVFARCNGFPCGISEIAADGTGMTNLSPPASNDYRPVFTPDGTKIVFVDYSAEGKSYIVIIDSESGAEVSRVQGTEDEDITNTKWSSDSKNILHETRHPLKNSTYVRRDEYGRNPSVILKNINGTNPIMDGSVVYYNSPHSGIGAIYAIDLG